jgi:hypothetical protein
MLLLLLLCLQWLGVNFFYKPCFVTVVSYVCNVDEIDNWCQFYKILCFVTDDAAKLMVASGILWVRQEPARPVYIMLHNSKPSLEKICKSEARDLESSLFCSSVSDEEKRFYKIGTWTLYFKILLCLEATGYFATSACA